MSLLTVIFLALLLTIVTVSFIRLAIIEQRQATDDDLTTRAFYAAESGVEDGKRALALSQSGGTVNLNADVCQPADVVPSGLLSADLSTEYTCQLIHLTPGDFLAQLDAWEAVTIPLTSADPFNKVKIEWHQPEASQPYTVRGNSDLGLPTAPDWISAEYPSMLRAAIFWHPPGSTFASTSPDVGQYALFINPASSNNPLSSANNGQVVNGFCDAAVAGGGYACSATITGVSPPGPRVFYLRLQSLYVGTDVRVTLLDNSGEVDLEDVQAAIDVTGRAGDVYRRIEARVPLTQFDYPFPDIALWSNTDICKNFTVTNDILGYNNTCPWAP